MSVIFIDTKFVERSHTLQAQQFGGAREIRDHGALASAMDRPRNKSSFGESDVPSLAAAYLFGLTMNCPFVEGNRRIAFITAIVFLELNGFQFTATNAEAYTFMMMLAAGEIDEDGAVRFLRDFTVPL